MTLQRLCAAGLKVSLGCRDKRGQFQILFQEPGRIGVRLGPRDLEEWALTAEENVSLAFEDRGFRYETVVTYQGSAAFEGIPCTAFTLPRTLRRADDNRLAHFAPDVAPKVTFTNVDHDAFVALEKPVWDKFAVTPEAKALVQKIVDAK